MIERIGNVGWRVSGGWRLRVGEQRRGSSENDVHWCPVRCRGVLRDADGSLEGLGAMKILRIVFQFDVFSSILEPNEECVSGGCLVRCGMDLDGVSIQTVESD